jgi:integrase
VGRPPRNKGRRFPADPPTVEEIVAVMRAAGRGTDGATLRALIVVLWRAGLRISEALALAETDLDARRGAVLVRHGKGDLCRIRHRSPYVAPGTMLRSGPVQPPRVDRRLVGWSFRAVVSCDGRC